MATPLFDQVIDAEYVPPYEGRALLPICEGWRNKMQLARKWKQEQFQDDADEAMQYFDGCGKWFWGKEYAEGPNGYLSKGFKGRLPSFTLTINMVSRFVQLFGPSMYQQNPQRTVHLRDRAPLPPELMMGMAQQAVQQQLGQQVMMLAPEQMQFMVEQQMMAISQQEMMEQQSKQAAADILQEYLNYTPDELDLVSNMRRCIDETIIKGAGVVWTELYTPPGSAMKMVGSFYDSIDNVFLDPDAEQSEDIKVIYRKCCHPYREVEKEYGAEAGSLKKYCTEESAESQGEGSTSSNYADQKERGQTNDLLTYYKVYSKCGIGVQLSGFGEDGKGNPTIAAHLRPILDELDDECYLVIVPGCPYPLNLPPELQQMPFEDAIQEDGTVVSAAEQAFNSIQEAVRWPIPFWLDGGWPCEILSFHDKPNQVWPVSHLKPGIGHLQFLNWAMSFLAERVMSSSNTYVGCLESMYEEFSKAHTKSEAGLSFLKIKSLQGASRISDVISFMNVPEVNMTLWQVIEAVNADFEKAVGLNELIYGVSDTQSRSAADVSIRQSNSNVRIDDMRRKVEKFSERLARKEAIAIRWMLTTADIQPIVGQMRAQVADMLLFNQPMDQVAREFSYTIAPGDGATKNRALEQQNMQAVMNTLMPIYAQFAQMGMVNPFNATVERFGKVFEFNTQGMQLPVPPVMPQPGQPGQEQEGPPAADAAA